jgi:hypothetical protein
LLYKVNPTLAHNRRGFRPAPHAKIESRQGRKRAVPFGARQILAGADQREQHLGFQPVEHIGERRRRIGSSACGPQPLSHPGGRTLAFEQQRAGPHRFKISAETLQLATQRGERRRRPLFVFRPEPPEVPAEPLGMFGDAVGAPGAQEQHDRLRPIEQAIKGVSSQTGVTPRG